jgi:hypothetical protein
MAARRPKLRVNILHCSADVPFFMELESADPAEKVAICVWGVPKPTDNTKRPVLIYQGLLKDAPQLSYTPAAGDHSIVVVSALPSTLVKPAPTAKVTVDAIYYHVIALKAE